MQEDWFERLDALGAARCLSLSDPRTGLRAMIVLDDVTLGPAAGGVRTRRYPSLRDALEDASRLARAMTIKCALAGLDAGGGKAVVIDHDGLDRPRAFERLGEHVEELGGLFRTAGDLGTTADDLARMASRTRYVHTAEDDLARSVARGLVGCVAACAAMRGMARSAGGLRVAVQGAGSIGAAVARALVLAGAEVWVADLDAALARAVAEAVGAQTIDAADVLLADVDVIAPCAVGGVLTADVASRLRAWAVCGAANNALAGLDAAVALAARGVLHVPDVIVSAGAVADGIGATVMGLTDRTALIDGLGDTALAVLEEARATGELSTRVAEHRARARIAAKARHRA